MDCIIEGKSLSPQKAPASDSYIHSQFSGSRKGKRKEKHADTDLNIAKPKRAPLGMRHRKEQHSDTDLTIAKPKPTFLSGQ